MAEPFIGEIRLFALNFVPAGWLACRGGTLPISQYNPLFAVIGTTYGGDGVNTFKLPDIAGKALVGTGTHPGGSTYAQGQPVGSHTCALTTASMPSHTHDLTAVIPASVSAETMSSTPSTAVTLTRAVAAGTTKPTRLYAAAATAGAHLAAATIPAHTETVGASHDNHQPYLVLQHCIAYEGLYPTTA